MSILVKITPQQFKQDASQLFALVMPILITQFSQAALTMVDAIMAGRVSALDLAAVSIGSGLWLPFILFATGVLIATTPLIGEAVGQNNSHEVAHITQQSLWAALAIGLLGFVCINFMPYLMPIMGVPDNIQPMARDYLFAISFGFPGVAIYTVLRCYCEALKRPEPVTLISVMGLLANIPLNYVFIYGMPIYGDISIPAMGGAGCGLSTTVVIWINVVCLTGYLYYSSHRQFVNTRLFTQLALPNARAIKTLLMLGVPIGVSIFFEASLFSFASLVISPLGELALASHQVTLAITSQIFMIPMSIAMALTIMIANRYGERNLAALQQVQTTGLICAVTIASVVMLVVFFSRDGLVSFFSKDIAVQSMAVHLLIYAVGYQIFDAWQVNVAGILRGIQDTTVPMLLTLFSYWVVALPMGIYLVRYTDIGVKGFWMALLTGLGLAAVLLSIRLKQQKHKLSLLFQ